MKAAQPFMLIVVHIGRTNCATCGFSPRFCCAHLIVTGSVAAEDLEKKARARAGSIPFATLIGLNPLNIRKAGITMNIWIKFAEITNAN